MIENLELSVGKCVDCPKVKKGFDCIRKVEELRSEVIEMAFDPEMEDVAEVLRDSVAASD
jgi:hypothetical protein